MEFQLDQAKEVLSRTPDTLNALLCQLPDAWVLSNEGPDSWSPFDIVGHLIHGEEADWLPRARIILRYGESRTFEPFDRFAMFENRRVNLWVSCWPSSSGCGGKFERVGRNELNV
jgi:hypothetical protein